MSRAAGPTVLYVWDIWFDLPSCLVVLCFGRYPRVDQLKIVALESPRTFDNRSQGEGFHKVIH